MFTYFSMEALGGFEPPNQSFADSCLTTWLQRHIEFIALYKFHVFHNYRQLSLSSFAYTLLYAEIYRI